MRRLTYYATDGFPLVQNSSAGPYPSFLGTDFVPLTVRRGDRRRCAVVLRLAGLGMLEASPDIIEGMIGEGYDPSVINMLATAGASDSQLQSLWNVYGAGTQEFAEAASELLFLLTNGRQGRLITQPVAPPAAAPPSPAPKPQPQTQTPAPAPAVSLPYPQPYYVSLPQPQSWWDRYGAVVEVGGGLLLLLVLFRR